MLLWNLHISGFLFFSHNMVYLSSIWSVWLVWSLCWSAYRQKGIPLIKCTRYELGSLWVFSTVIYSLCLGLLKLFSFKLLIPEDFRLMFFMMENFRYFYLMLGNPRLTTPFLSIYLSWGCITRIIFSCSQHQVLLPVHNSFLVNIWWISWPVR